LSREWGYAVHGTNSYWAKAYLQAKRVIPQGHLAQNP
jgi:hypothetical protein